MADPSKLLPIGEAALRLGVPVSRLRYWADHGYVPSIRTPTKRRYFTVEALDALAIEMMPSPAPPQDADNDDDQ
jgi:predicted site-specific integrase-resolvase